MWPVATKLGGSGRGVEGGRRTNLWCCHKPVLPRVTVFPESPVLSWVGPGHISHGCPRSLSELLFQRQTVLNQVLCFGRGMEPSFLILLLWESVFWVPNNSTYKYILGIWPSYICTPRTACSRGKKLAVYSFVAPTAGISHIDLIRGISYKVPTFGVCSESLPGSVGYRLSSSHRIGFSGSKEPPFLHSCSQIGLVKQSEIISANGISRVGTIDSETWFYFRFDFLKYRLPGLTPGSLFK